MTWPLGTSPISLTPLLLHAICSLSQFLKCCRMVCRMASALAFFFCLEHCLIRTIFDHPIALCHTTLLQFPLLHISLQITLFTYMFIVCFPVKCFCKVLALGLSRREHTCTIFTLSFKFHLLRTEMATQRGNSGFLATWEACAVHGTVYKIKFSWSFIWAHLGIRTTYPLGERE